MFDSKVFQARSRRSWGFVARSAVLVIVTGAVALLGVVGSAGAATAAAGPQKGGTFTYIYSEPATFNPLAQGTLNTFGAVLYQSFDTLMIEDNATQKVKPVMLKSVTMSPDAGIWTFTLRPNIKFTDGTVFNSAAIKAAFDYAANPANRAGGLNVAQQVASWDITDPLVAKLTLTSPDVTFARSVISRLAMIPSPTALASMGAAFGTAPDKIVGAGPFTLTSWVKGSQMTFTRNASYWNQPRPYLDTVIVKVIPDPISAYNTLASGGADALKLPTLEVYNQAKSASTIRVYPTQGELSKTRMSDRSFWEFNFPRAPFNDALARQAVYTALDPAKYAAAIGQKAVTTVLDKKSFWYDPVGQLPKFDAQAAQKLIDQWSAKNGGKPLEFSIMQATGVVSLGGDAQAMQAAMAGYNNLKVNVEIIPQATVTARAPTGNFDLYPTAIGGSDPDVPWNGTLRSNGGRNYGKYNNPAMDAAIDAGKAETDPSQRQKIYATVQKLLVTDLPHWIMPSTIYRPEGHFGMSKTQTFRDLTFGAYMSVDTSNLWIAPKKK